MTSCAPPANSNLVFVTGTDTGVGKTVLTGLLLLHLRRRGIHARAMKPFLTGGWEDAELLSRLQDGELTPERVSPFFFRRPAAPYAAARSERRNVPLAQVEQAVRSEKERCEVLIVEGIGGVRVPLGRRYTVAELIAALNPRVIVAAADRLGAINHTLLTVRDLQRIGMQEVSVAMMQSGAEASGPRDNAAVVREWLRPTPVIAVPWLGGNASSEAGLRLGEKKFAKVVARVAGSARVFSVAARMTQR